MGSEKSNQLGEATRRLTAHRGYCKKCDKKIRDFKGDYCPQGKLLKKLIDELSKIADFQNVMTPLDKKN